MKVQVFTSNDVIVLMSIGNYAIVCVCLGVSLIQDDFRFIIYHDPIEQIATIESTMLLFA